MITLAEDNRMEVQIDLPDAELLVLFKMAHELDITFNAFVEDVLREFLENAENDLLLNKLDGSSEPPVVSGTWPYPS